MIMTPVANFKNYLLLCCISQGFQIDAPILENILKDCYNGSYDLRKALMSCQIFCQNYAIDILGETNHEIYIRKIKYNSFNETRE